MFTVLRLLRKPPAAVRRMSFSRREIARMTSAVTFLLVSQSGCVNLAMWNRAPFSVRGLRSLRLFHLVQQPLDMVRSIQWYGGKPRSPLVGPKLAENLLPKRLRHVGWSRRKSTGRNAVLVEGQPGRLCEIVKKRLDFDGGGQASFEPTHLFGSLECEERVHVRVTSGRAGQVVEPHTNVVVVERSGHSPDAPGMLQLTLVKALVHYVCRARRSTVVVSHVEMTSGLATNTTSEEVVVRVILRCPDDVLGCVDGRLVHLLPNTCCNRRLGLDEAENDAVNLADSPGRLESRNIRSCGRHRQLVKRAPLRPFGPTCRIHKYRCALADHHDHSRVRLPSPYSLCFPTSPLPPPSLLPPSTLFAAHPHL